VTAVAACDVQPEVRRRLLQDSWYHRDQSDRRYWVVSTSGRGRVHASTSIAQVHYFKPFQPRPGATHRIDGTFVPRHQSRNVFRSFVAVDYVVDAPGERTSLRRAVVGQSSPDGSVHCRPQDQLGIDRGEANLEPDSCAVAPDLSRAVYATPNRVSCIDRSDRRYGSSALRPRHRSRRTPTTAARVRAEVPFG
jgi:hypothetical protein